MEQGQRQGPAQPHGRGAMRRSEGEDGGGCGEEGIFVSKGRDRGKVRGKGAEQVYSTAAVEGEGWAAR